MKSDLFMLTILLMASCWLVELWRYVLFFLSYHNIISGWLTKPPLLYIPLLCECQCPQLTTPKHLPTPSIWLLCRTSPPQILSYSYFSLLIIIKFCMYSCAFHCIYYYIDFCVQVKSNHPVSNPLLHLKQYLQLLK